MYRRGIATRSLGSQSLASLCLRRLFTTTSKLPPSFFPPETVPQISRGLGALSWLAPTLAGVMPAATSQKNNALPVYLIALAIPKSEASSYEKKSLTL